MVFQVKDSMELPWKPSCFHKVFHMESHGVSMDPWKISRISLEISRGIKSRSLFLLLLL